MLAYLPNLAIQLPVYLPNWLPTLSCLSSWRQTGDKPIFKALPLAKLKKLSPSFVSLLHACDRAENLCFPSLLFLYTHGATGCFRGSLVPFSTDPPLRVSSSFFPAIFLFTFYVLLAFQFVFFLDLRILPFRWFTPFYFIFSPLFQFVVFFLPFQVLSSSSESPCSSLSLLISCLFSNNFLT